MQVRVTPLVVVAIGGSEAVLTAPQARRLARRLLQPIETPPAAREEVLPRGALDSSAPSVRRAQ